VQIHRIVGSAETGFQPTVGQFEEALRKASPEAILVTHPGSPSGLLLPDNVRRWLLDGARSGSFSLLVDEVFMDFCEEASFQAALDSCPNLTLIRSMTKFYGIPGLRLGYVLTSDSLAGRLRHFLPPWSVNTLAQVAGSYCLSQEEYRRRTLDLVAMEREFLQQEMGTIKGLTPLPGVANYLLIRLGERLPAARVLVRDLAMADRILVRDCSSFEGLGDSYFRVAVRLRGENERLLRALARWVADHSVA
jgi:threonine-phosphate decarboxylase